MFQASTGDQLKLKRVNTAGTATSSRSYICSLHVCHYSSSIIMPVTHKQALHSWRQ